MGGEVFLRYLEQKEGTKGVVSVNREDGSVISTWGQTDTLMNDIGAFVGSTMEVVAKDLKTGDMEYIYVVESTRQLIILPYENAFFCIHVDDTLNAHQFAQKILSDIKNNSLSHKEDVKTGDTKVEEVKEEKVEEKKEEKKVVRKSSAVQRALLKAKIKQLQYLIEEFSKGENVDKWIEILKSEMETSDPDEKISRYILISDNTLSFNNDVDIDVTKDEISVITKKFVDALFKAAVKEYGPAEAKQMVSNVISRLRKKG